MYTEEDLASAVKAGALTEETAAAFRAHVAQLKNESAVDEAPAACRAGAACAIPVRYLPNGFTTMTTGA